MADTLVLCYHAVSHDWEADLSVTPDGLERQLSHLVRKGYRGATFSEAVAGAGRGKVVAVTFDDAYRSVLELGLPILAELELPATVFAPTAYVGGEWPMSWPGIDHWLLTPHRKELLGLSWDELAELRAAGWEVGSHTRTHPHLTDVGDSQLDAELRDSKAELEDRLGAPCRSIAYPYGDVDERVVAAARRTGYEAGAALPDRFHAVDPLRWPRVGVTHEDSQRRFQRQVTRTMRLIQVSPSWRFVVRGLELRNRLRARRKEGGGGGRAVPADAAGPPGQASPALRLLASDGRTVVRRPGVLALGLLGRLALARVHTVWPELRAPLFVVGASDARPARWMRATFEREGRGRRFAGAATWNVLRARGLVFPDDAPLALDAANRALGDPLRSPRVAVYSPTGTTLSKATAFVFERGADAPDVVVKLMPERRETVRLQREIEFVEVLRELLSSRPDLAQVLPLAPHFTGEVRGEYVVVQPVDPLAAHTGRECREPALAWLREFHSETATNIVAWGRPDDRAAIDQVAYAWDRARPGVREELVARVMELSAELHGEAVPRCAVHGDFWRGNLSWNGSALRIYDWEWAEFDGRPFFDLWTYELGELRERAFEGERNFAEPLAAALLRMESMLRERDLDERFALATLVPAIGHLTFRIRRETGGAGGNEPGSMRVMAAAERLVLGHR